MLSVLITVCAWVTTSSGSRACHHPQQLACPPVAGAVCPAGLCWHSAPFLGQSPPGLGGGALVSVPVMDALGVCVWGGFQFLSRSVSVPGLCFGRWLSHVQSLVGGAVLTLSGGRQQPFLEAGLASHCVTVTLGCRRLHVGCAGLTHLPAVGELLGRLCLLCVLSPHVPQLSRGVSTLCRLPELCRRLSLWNPARDSRRPRPESSGLCPRPGSPPHPGACLQAELGRLVQGRSPLASL